MDRHALILAALSPSKGQPFTPVQVQKLFFLLDKNISTSINGPHFNFQPYNYGPFDHQVYSSLETLASEGLVTIATDGRWRDYRLSPKGQVEGERLLAGLPTKVRGYIEQVSTFVRSLSFMELVAAIYKAYPEMRANSVFQD